MALAHTIGALNLASGRFANGSPTARWKQYGTCAAIGHPFRAYILALKRLLKIGERIIASPLSVYAGLFADRPSTNTLTSPALAERRKSPAMANWNNPSPAQAGSRQWRPRN